MRASEVAVAPTRSWKSAPWALPSVILALVIVTRRPISMSRPVPGFRFPNLAVVYHSVCQAVAALPSMASRASCALWPLP